MVEIFYDKEKSMELMQRIEEKFGESSRRTARGSEMHVSDLTGCQLRPYCRVIGIPRETTKQQVGIMVFGIIAETILGWTFPKDQLQFPSNLSLLEGEENIFGHIDIYEKFIFPLEVKASRKNIFKRSEIPIYWVEQLMSYMAMQGATKGWLVLFNVFSCQIMAFQFRLSKDDILAWLITLTNRASIIKDAVRRKDPSNLEINPQQYEMCDYKHHCPRADECKRRHKDMQAEKARDKKEKKNLY